MAQEFVSWGEARIAVLGHDRFRYTVSRNQEFDQTISDDGSDSVVGSHRKCHLWHASPHLFVEERGQCLAEVSNTDPMTTYYVTWQVPNETTSVEIETWTWSDSQIVDPGFPWGEAGDGLDDLVSNPFNSRLPSVTYAWNFRRTRWVYPDFLVSDVGTVATGSTLVHLAPSDMGSVPGGKAFSGRKKLVRAPAVGDFTALPDPGANNSNAVISAFTLVLEGSPTCLGMWRRTPGILVTLP